MGAFFVMKSLKMWNRKKDKLKSRTQKVIMKIDSLLERLVEGNEIYGHGRFEFTHHSGLHIIVNGHEIPKTRFEDDIVEMEKKYIKIIGIETFKAFEEELKASMKKTQYNVSNDDVQAKREYYLQEVLRTIRVPFISFEKKMQQNEFAGKKVLVAKIVNQDAFKDMTKEIIKKLAETSKIPEDKFKRESDFNRIFHVCLANKTGDHTGFLNDPFKDFKKLLKR